MTTPRLVRPDIRYAESYSEALREFLAESEHPAAMVTALDDISAKIDELLALGEEPARGAVAQEVFWLVRGMEYIGSIYIRRTPHGRIAELASHIYYEIRPSRRRQSYGTLILQLGLQKVFEMGLRAIILTCDETNIASRTIIERNGGRLLDSVSVTEDGKRVRMLKYQINLAERGTQLAA